jgi:T5SS/PEP-CTERM-associated repeat protein
VQAAEIVTNLAGEVYWKNASSGAVSRGGNWASGSTPGASDHVIFSRPAASFTVTLDSNLTNNRASVRQGTVTWNLGGNTWALTNTSQATPSLSISEFQGVSAVTATGGGTLSSVIAMIGAGAGSTGTLTVTGTGTVWNNSDSVFVGGTSSAAGGRGTLNVAGGAAVHVSNTLKVYSNGEVNYTGGNLSAGNLVLSGNGQLVMSAGKDKSLVLSSVSIDAAANLDLNDNAIIVNYGAETTNATRDTIRNLLVNGRNAAPGNPAPWNGVGGITSTFAHTNGNGSNLAIGYADNAQLAVISASGSYTSFGGQTVSSTTVLVMMTRGADANLDGVVDGQDVSIIGTHFNKPGSGQWYFGDFDYSGSCDGADVSVLGTTFNKTSPTLSPAQLSAEFGSAFAAAFEQGATGTAVPEPVALSVMGLGAMALAGRRRRRRGACGV